MSLTPLFRAAATAAIMLLAAHPALAQSTASASATTPTVFLVGERPVWEVGARNAAPDVVPAAARELAADIKDHMTTGELVADTARKADELASKSPDIVIYFGGKADSDASVAEEKQLAALGDVGKKFLQAGAKVYFVPSAPSLGAAATANLRIGANLAEVEFVEPGTEFDGNPYEATFREIKKLASAQPEVKPLASVPDTVTPDQVIPPVGETTVRLDPAETSAVIMMKPPAPLKQFDPKSRAGSKPPRLKKKPEASK